MQEEKAEAQVKVPAALIIVLLGIAAALWQNPRVASRLRLGPSKPQFTMPTKHQWLKGAPWYAHHGLGVWPSSAPRSALL